MARVENLLVLYSPESPPLNSERNLSWFTGMRIRSGVKPGSNRNELLAGLPGLGCVPDFIRLVNLVSTPAESDDI